MKACSFIINVILSAFVCPAAETGSPPAVLELAPADAVAIVYLRKPAELFSHPLTAGLTDDAEMAAALTAASETFSGPFMLAVSGVPWNPASMRIEFAAHIAAGDQEVFDALSERIFPSLERSLPFGSAGRVTPSGRLRAIQLPGPAPLILYGAARDGRVYASGDRASVELWLDGVEPADRFDGSDDYARFLDDPSSPLDAFIYMNARPFIRFASAAFDSATMPGFSTEVGLDRFESATLTARWSGTQVEARLALAWADSNGILPALLAPRGAETKIAALVPPDFTFFVRGAWQSAADASAGVNRILEFLDPDIVSEFADECHEFQGEFGFDPRVDFLANLVDEWIVAGRVDAAGRHSWMAATRLADVTLFEGQLSTLCGAFALPFEHRQYRDVLVRSTPRDDDLHLSLACAGDYLIVARDAETVCQVVDAWLDKRALTSPPGYQALARRLPEQSGWTAFCDVSRLFGEFVDSLPADAVASVGPMIGRIASAGAGVAVTTTRSDGIVAIDAVLHHGADSMVLTDLSRVAAVSVERSREQSRRMVSMANIRGIVQGCMNYSNAHKGVWPTAASDLVREGLCSVSQFNSPYGDLTITLTADNVDTASAYLYRNGKDRKPDEVVVCERTLRQGGANFGFADGHVEWISGPDAANLLAEMQRTAN